MPSPVRRRMATLNEATERLTVAGVREEIERLRATAKKRDVQWGRAFRRVDDEARTLATTHAFGVREAHQRETPVGWDAFVDDIPGSWFWETPRPPPQKTAAPPPRPELVAVVSSSSSLKLVVEVKAQSRKRTSPGAAKPEAPRAPQTLISERVKKRPRGTPMPSAPPARTPSGTPTPSPPPASARLRPELTSRFFGVCWRHSRSQWVSSYWDPRLGRDVFLGYFDDEQLAARVYNDAVKEADLRTKMNPVSADGRLVEKKAHSSRFNGVNWDKVLKRWKGSVRKSTRLGLDGKLRYIGLFKDEAECARAVDAYIREAMPSVAAAKTNFPTDDERAACAAAKAT